ncbi:MAG: hypothetical protein EXQ60_04390 [Candidatus Nanopelagicales bacterium]|nr:hypothetical protein [Candidatus Nanopelagicales bacterium]
MRVLLLAALFVIGLVTGLLGAFVQANRWVTAWPWGQLVVPWGVALVLLLLLILIRGGAWLVHSRFGAWTLLAGWLVGTMVMSTQSPSGDLALSGGTRQWIYLLGGIVLGSAVATFPVIESQSRLR